MLTLLCALLAGCGVRRSEVEATEEGAVSVTTVVEPTPTLTATVAPIELEKTTPIPTSTDATETASLDEESLRQEWRPAINQAILLFETCTMMYETHFEYWQGKIDLEHALHELNAESDVLAFAWRGFTSGPVPSDTTGPLMFRLEEQIRVLIGLLDPIDEDAIGAPEVLATLSQACGALEGLQSEVVSTSMAAGLTEADVDEIFEAMTLTVKDLYEELLEE